MAHKEYQPSPTTLEKGLWWTQVGGAIAAIVGAMNHFAGLAVSGAVVYVGAKWSRDQISNARHDAIKATH